MSRDLKQASGLLFYVLGSLTIVTIIFVLRERFIALLIPILESLDLPLLLIGMVYGGSSLYCSLTQEGEASLSKALGIGLPLLVIFSVFVYMDFALPFAEV